MSSIYLNKHVNVDNTINNMIETTKLEAPLYGSIPSFKTEPSLILTSSGLKTGPVLDFLRTYITLPFSRWIGL